MINEHPSKLAGVGHSRLLIERVTYTDSQPKVNRYLFDYSPRNATKPGIWDAVFSNSRFGGQLFGVAEGQKDEEAEQMFKAIKVRGTKSWLVRPEDGDQIVNYAWTDIARRGPDLIPYRVFGKGVLFGSPNSQSCASWTVTLAEAGGIKVGGFFCDSPWDNIGRWYTGSWTSYFKDWVRGPGRAELIEPVPGDLVPGSKENPETAGVVQDQRSETADRQSPGN